MIGMQTETGQPPRHRTPDPDPNADSDIATRTADQACRECRRRKSKCDRTIPVCRLCGKFARVCTYEKSSRTPLTRTYLSQVESELARTKALLARFMPGEGHEGDHGHLGSTESYNYNARNHALGPIPRQDSRGHAIPLPTPSLDGQGHHRARASTGSTLVGPVGPGPRPASESRSVGGTTAFSLETPPSSSNFEWDERAGGDKFVDGMASLTSRSNEGGYLGSASGAALLRLTETRADGPTSAAYESGQEQDYQGQGNGHGCRQSIPFALTSMSQLEPFIDAYFSLYHASYPIVHEATFRAQFMEIIPRPSGSRIGNAWQVLLFVIAALGVFTSSTQTTDIDLALFDAAKERLSIDVLETGNLVLVQALTLISNYLQKRNKPNSGYNYMGLARRVAMGIGLHKEFPSWDASLLTLEMRRRVWYGLYIFDVGAMITFSRPLDFPVQGVDVCLPVNAHDSDITSQTRTLPPPAQESTIYTHLLAQAKFHLATSHIYSKIISHPLPPAVELLQLDDQFITGWLNDLPPYFSESAPQHPKFALAHAILRWRYRNFRILMYRPFLVGQLMSRAQRNPTAQGSIDVPADTSEAINRCLTTSTEAVTLISTYWSAPGNRNMMACWYALYFLFQAVLIPVICLRNDPQSHLATSWREQVLSAVEVLELMCALNSTATRCLGVIERLCGEYLKPPPGVGWARPTEESPQTQLANLYPLMWPTLDVGESTIMEFMSRLPMQ
ncbi:transcription factor domain-containing protein [Aspergillus undulatus]|uniref:transcription factor domain-containing protein n=1 Tax=Aspergillus undulatus TaxID=1810928 RepID=UPI003CCCCD17